MARFPRSAGPGPARWNSTWRWRAASSGRWPIPRLTGAPEPGDRVLLNTGALELGLGTGGYALVVAIPDRLPPDPDEPGHLIKARYTPLQACVLGADEQGSDFHELLREADDLGGLPVVVADLHSALPAILAGYLAARPERGAPRAAANRLRDARRRRAARLVLPDRRRADRGWLAGRDCDGGPGLRRRPGGRHPAQRAAGGPARAGRRASRRLPGTRQSGHWHDVGILRRGRGRGGQCRLGPARQASRIIADQPGRPARAAPGHLPPQPDRIRPGRPDQGRHRRARARWRVRRAAAERQPRRWLRDTT